jgi:MtN3 and saliva related transmembrane protein
LDSNNIIMIIGLVGAALTTFSFLPQAIKAIRTRHTKDLSMPMLVMLICGIICWVTYGIFIKDTPLIAANSVSLVFMTTLFFIKKKYG